VIHRFFCCSDTHGKLPPIPAAASFEATLHAGDVYRGAELSRRDRSESPLEIPGWIDPEQANVRAWIERAGPVYVVRGNHDLADPHRFFARSQDVTSRVVRLADKLLLAGIGWHGERYYELPGESEMERVCTGVLRQMRRVATSSDRIVLSHYPPRGEDVFAVAVPASGWWHGCTRALVVEIKPIAVVQGHIHELAGRTAKASGVTFVHPGKQGVILSVNIVDGTVDVVPL
jgi:Icc-related predicted phosphoesterase